MYGTYPVVIHVPFAPYYQAAKLETKHIDDKDERASHMAKSVRNATPRPMPYSDVQDPI
ncbi:hypothetical protein [Rhizobium leguminosarum]|uniref:hypothetical protein n=1 Tax=Rhizobium leguminosarum TaxID=384 RepID=UPI001C9655DD|nr:hypothetical protein [Rhizobium leguminosarum]MBY5371812.1 hypothetical protein [Rhizobium leguminosarum]